MLLPKKDTFLEEVLSYINFSYDRESIRSELECHISDKMAEYMEQGYDEETSEQLTIENMGEPREIGIELNKQHNPFLGWIWIITNVMVTLFAIVNIYLVGSFFIISLFNKNPIHDHPKSDIIYQIDINEKVILDDTVIHFTNLIYDTSGGMNIFYKSYSNKFWLIGGSSDYIGELTDNLGNTYLSISGISRGGLITKSQKRIDDFSRDADTLIIRYDLYNRKFEVEIPLKVGDNNE